VLNAISFTLALRHLRRRVGPILLASMAVAAAIVSLGTWLLLKDSLIRSSVTGAENAMSFRAIGQYHQRGHRRLDRFSFEQLRAIETQFESEGAIGVASLATSITTNTGVRIPITVQITTPAFLEALGVHVVPFEGRPAVQSKGAIISSSLEEVLSGFHDPEIYLNQIPLVIGGAASRFSGFSTTVEKTLWIDYTHPAAQSELDSLHDEYLFLVAVNADAHSASRIRSGLDLLASTRPELFNEISIQLLGAIRYGADVYSSASKGLGYIAFAALVVFIFALTASVLHARSTLAYMTATLLVMEGLGCRWSDKALIVMSDLAAILLLAILISVPGIDIATESIAELTGINELMTSIDFGQAMLAIASVAAAIFIPLVIHSLLVAFRSERKSNIGKSSSYIVGIQFSFFMVAVFTFSVLLEEFIQISSGQKSYSFEGLELTKVDFGFSGLPTYDVSWHNAVRQLLDQLNYGSASAALAATLAPLSGEQWEDGMIYNGGQEIRVKINRVSPGYFSMIGLAVSGETPEFEYIQNSYRSPGQAIVNSRLLSAIPEVKNQGAIALATLDGWERMPSDASNLPAISRLILGSVSEGSSGVSAPSFISENLESLQPIVYLVDTWFNRAILLTRNVSPSRIEYELLRLKALAPDLTIEWRKSGEAIEQQLLARERSLLTLTFIMTIGVASISILSAFSLVQSWLIQNRRALAIRRALGATMIDIYRLVFRHFSIIVAVSIILYVPLGFFVTVVLGRSIEAYFVASHSAPGVILLVLSSCLILFSQSRKFHRLDMRALSDE
jgi:hypothetical protein